MHKAEQGPVSLRLMTSQFKDIVTHTQKYMTVKYTFYGVWVQNFVWNFKGALWNFTQNFEPIHRKICILWGGKNLTTYDILELWHLKSLWDGPQDRQAIMYPANGTHHGLRTIRGNKIHMSKLTQGPSRELTEWWYNPLRHTSTKSIRVKTYL